MDSIGGMWNAMLQCIGKSNQSWSPVNIKGYEYCSNKHIMGMCLQRVPGGFSTGLSTRAGDLVRVQLNNIDPTYVDTALLIMSHDVIIELREQGVQVFD
jgi:hypothetical protein